MNRFYFTWCVCAVLVGLGFGALALEYQWRATRAEQVRERAASAAQGRAEKALREVRQADTTVRQSLEAAKKALQEKVEESAPRWQELQEQALGENLTEAVRKIEEERDALRKQAELLGETLQTEQQRFGQKVEQTRQVLEQQYDSDAKKAQTQLEELERSFGSWIQELRVILDGERDALGKQADAVLHDLNRRQADRVRIEQKKVFLQQLKDRTHALRSEGEKVQERLKKMGEDFQGKADPWRKRIARVADDVTTEAEQAQAATEVRQLVKQLQEAAEKSRQDAEGEQKGFATAGRELRKQIQEAHPKVPAEIVDEAVAEVEKGVTAEGDRLNKFLNAELAKAEGEAKQAEAGLAEALTLRLGGVVVLVLATELLKEDDAHLKRQLNKFLMDHKGKVGRDSVQVVYKKDQRQTWRDGHPLLRVGSGEAFRCEDYVTALKAAYAVFEELNKKAGGKLRALLIWKSDYNPNDGPAEGVARRPEKSDLHLFWLNDKGNDNSPRLRVWLGKDRVHVVREVQQLAAAMQKTVP